MPQIVPYLTFGGNCREAMTFYKQALGGDLNIQTVGESPMAQQMPPEAHKNVMHSALTNGTMNLYASDQMGSDGITPGNTITLLINCTSEAEINSLFSKLSAGGKVVHPLKEEFWGSIYGDFSDKFGIRWMMNWDKPKK
jgi:PhnB protein